MTNEPPDCDAGATALIATPAPELIREEQAIDEQLILRIEKLPKEAGWVLITAGVIGVIAPGIIGAPFLVAGVFVLAPGGPRWLSRWAGRKPRKFAHSALRQICRFLDDLDRRYPHRPNTRADATQALDYRGHVDVQ
jgi:hypothetical protein